MSLYSNAVTITDKRKNKQVYFNAFATKHHICNETVAAIVEAGRSRWKVENENNNVLKSKGYHLEYNFGHGVEHLSELLVTLNLLAFLMHTLLELVEGNYQQLRTLLVTRKDFFVTCLLLPVISTSTVGMLCFNLCLLKLPTPPKFPK